MFFVSLIWISGYRVGRGTEIEGPHSERPPIRNYVINCTAKSSNTAPYCLLSGANESHRLDFHAARRSHERRGNDALRVVSRDAGPQA